MAVTYLDNLRELIPYFKKYAIFYVSEFNPKGEIVLLFDSIQETNFKSDTVITSYPTEDNNEKTDGKFYNPSIITVRGIIQKDTAVSEAVGNLIGVNLYRKTKSELEKFIKVVCRLDIQTKNGFYKNYSLMSYEIPENIDNYSYFEVIMTFKQNIVNTSDNVYVKSVSDLATVAGGWLSKVGLA